VRGRRSPLFRRLTKLPRDLTREGRLNALIISTFLRNQLQYKAVANPYSVLWVCPAEVEEKLTGSCHRSGPPGTVLGGDWDLEVIDFARSHKFQGLLERFVHGVPWEETTLFRDRFSAQLERGGEIEGMCSLDELATYYRERIDPLYEAIASQGFRAPSFLRRISAVYVYIGRRGKIIWGPGGNHRLAIAKILNVGAIPVRVHLRHQMWQEIRDGVRTNASSALAEDLSRHVDLAALLDTGKSRPT
jgi:hypothetical protein